MIGVQVRVSPSSFRDPAGYVFLEDGVYKRAVMAKGRADYEFLMSSGLYAALVERGLLLAHEEDSPGDETLPGTHKILIPEQLPYISYSYEWSFEQFKDAAILTLEVQRLAMKHGMSLKDASSFNVQFRGSQGVFIDTLSFERNQGGPWAAYDQFCRHFLAPLLLMARVSVGFNRFLRGSLEGFPLDMASRSLPWWTRLQIGPLLHIHLHARSQRKGSGGASRRWSGRDPKQAIVESLLSTVRSLRVPGSDTSWSRYYDSSAHYSAQAEEFKKNVVSSTVASLRPKLVYDLGGNTGRYSRLVTAEGIRCVCYDADPVCVNEAYLQSKARQDPYLLPLFMDLVNPSPPLGLDLEERQGFVDRAKPDLVLALAVLHHLRIAGNVPLGRICRFLARMTPYLLIEFVPREDPMVEEMLRGREDRFEDYSWPVFCETFSREFTLENQLAIPDTLRSLCLFRRRV